MYPFLLSDAPEYLDSAKCYAVSPTGRFVLYKEPKKVTGKLPWLVLDLREGMNQKVVSFATKKMANCFVVYNVDGTECAPFFFWSTMKCPIVRWVKFT